MRSIGTTETAIIQQIKKNLSDNYDPGFPILKELVQNADDAEATILNLGLLSGIPFSMSAAEFHPMLSGPALCVLNDGRFDKEDDEKIALMGEGSKGGDLPAIGKFGLGLKSVFHLCEAFFYVASPLQPHGESVRSDFINPWAKTRLHPEWKHDLSDHDTSFILDRIAPLVPPGGEWFCLWIPLRTREQLGSVHPLIGEHPGDDILEQPGGELRQLPADVIFSPHHERKLAAIIPMMKHLRRVDFWTARRSEPVRRITQVYVPDLASTTQVGRQSSTFSAPLTGTAVVERCDADQDGPVSVIELGYRGSEARLDNNRIAAIQKARNWPVQVWTDPATGEMKDEREKAVPHVAVLLTSAPAIGKGSLAVTPAVFLPLGDAAGVSSNCPGSEDYQLVLHGYFFVDAGRRGINFGPEKFELEVLDDLDERQIRWSWNRLLRDEGVLPLVLPALERFAAERGRGGPEMDRLTSALMKIEDFGGEHGSPSGFLNGHRAALCGRNQWIRRVTGHGPEWQLVDPDLAVWTLPDPPALSEAGEILPFRVFPALADVSGSQAIVFEGSPRLSLKEPEPLSLDVLVRLLDTSSDFRPTAIFSNAVWAHYALNSINHAVARRQRTESFNATLLQVVRLVLRESDLQPDSDVFPLVSKLVALVPADKQLVLRAPPQELLDLNLSVLVVPSSIAADSVAGRVRLGVADALRLLEALESYKKSSGTANATRTSLACEVIDACSTSMVRSEVLQACRQRRLFDGWDLAQDRAAATSFAELDAAFRHGLLFLRGESSEGTARCLQTAVDGPAVLLTSAQVGRTLFGKAVEECGPAACLRVLAVTPKLAGVAARLSLLDLLLKQEGLWSSASQPAEVRYLLHARSAAFSDTGQLFATQGRGPWAKLLKRVLELRGEGWRVVPAELTAIVRPAQVVRLGITAADAGSVAAYLAGVIESFGFIDGSEPVWPNLVCEDFSQEEFEILFDNFPLQGICPPIALRLALQNLPIHRTIDGSQGRSVMLRTWVGSNGYLDDPSRGFPLDEGLRVQVVEFERDPHPLRLAKQVELFGDRQLTASSLLRLAASNDGLRVHWSTILHALNQVSHHPAREDLRLKPWVPTARGNAIAPIDVPFIEGLDLKRELPDVELVCEGDLAADFRRHPCYEAGRRLFLNAEEALSYLGRQLATREKYYLGPQEITSISLSEVLSAFEGGGDCMPCCPLLRRLVELCSAEDCSRHLVPHLLGPITDPARMVAILNHLADRDRSRHEGDRSWRDVFVVYLAGAAKVLGFTAHVLPKIQLLNARGRWCNAASLCVDWPGVSPMSVLSVEQQKILIGRVAGERSAGPDMMAASGRADKSLPKAADAAADQLRTYFARWSAAPPGAVGGLLSLLGNHPKIVAYAEELAQPRTVQGIRDMLDWRILQGDHTFGAGKDARELIASRRFVIEFDPGRTLDVVNILGESIKVPADKNPNHLLLGRPVHSRDDTGKLYVRIVLRELDPATLTPASASDLLRESAQAILDEVFCQWDIDLEAMWQDLAATDQLDIVVTQQILLSRAPANLPKLRTDRIPTLRTPLLAMDLAFHRLEEAKQAHGPLRQKRVAEAEDALEQAKQMLANLLTKDRKVQQEVVEALQGKVEESGYTPASVAFELLQNADDASVEYHEMHGTDESTRPDTSRFAIELDGSLLRFFHWGRPINKYRCGQFDGSTRGFCSDLSKMLSLGESDKLAGVDVKRTTGRFGLGFKSVFLICSRPRVISSWLSFEVVAGIYPERLDGSCATRMRETLSRLGPPDGTLVELDVSEGTPLTQVPKSELGLMDPRGPLGRFLRLAHLMVVCTKQIRRCEVRSGGKLWTLEWRPATLLGIPNLQFGTVRPAINGSPPFGLLVLGDGQVGQLLVAIDGRGPLAMDDQVPSIWVTAPTHHEDGLGFAISGGFEVTPGRTHLMGESIANCERAARIGRLVGEQLEWLFDATETVEGWDRMRAAMGLEVDASREEFWGGLFELFAGRLHATKAMTRPLMIEVLWANEERGMHRLVHRRRVLPSGLPGLFRCLARIEEVRHVVGRSLTAGPNPAFTTVSRWKSFQDKVRPGKTVASALADWLPELGVRLPADSKVLELVDVIELELGGDQVEAEVAARLAEVVGRQDIESNSGAHGHDHSSQRLRVMLGRLQFLACDGSWRPVPELLVSGGESENRREDEMRRVAFAPASAVLSEKYQKSAIDFFLLCRLIHSGRLHTGVAEMVRWAVAAMGEASRVAVLRYLIEGELAAGLGEELRKRVTEDATLWLSTLERDPLLGTAFPDINHSQLVLARLGLVRVIWQPSPEPVDEPPPPVDAVRILRNIAEAWRRGPGRRRYEHEIFPGGQPPRLDREGLSDRLQTRREWMKLLMLGSMHTIGLAKFGEHREFLSLCERRGWLDVFADPEVDPKRWLGVLDQFLEPAVRDVKYYRGMHRFISFYQFARHLTDYAYCFLDADWSITTLSQVLRSRENPYQSGGGYDVPPLTAALGIGACFVVRELVHAGLIDAPSVHHYCYVPVRRVRLLLAGLGCRGLLDPGIDRWEISHHIHTFLVEHLGEKEATFGGDFDLPLLAAADGRLTYYGLTEEHDQYMDRGMRDLGE